MFFTKKLMYNPSKKQSAGKQVNYVIRCKFTGFDKLSY